MLTAHQEQCQAARRARAEALLVVAGFGGGAGRARAVDDRANAHAGDGAVGGATARA